MIQTQNLTKRFGDYTALEGLQLNIPKGCIYGLVGPNGSGKSTLMRLISGVYQSDDGIVSIDGDPVWENESVKAKVFFLSDDLYFLPKTTLDESAAFYASVYPGFSFEKYEHLKTMFPLDAKKRVSTYSKGMRRQAAILLALSSGCEYLLLDEAFDGLDVVVRLMVKKLLVDEILDRKLTVVVTSHNLRELEDLCDQIGLLHGGKILLEKDLDALKLGICKVQAAFENDPDWKSIGFDIIEQEKKGKLSSMLIRGEATQVVSRLQSLGASYCEAVPLTLEEIFLAEMEAVGYDANNILE